MTVLKARRDRADAVERRGQAVEQMRELNELAESQRRDLTKDEARKFDRLDLEARELTATIAQLEVVIARGGSDDEPRSRIARRDVGPTGPGGETRIAREPVLLGPEQRLAPVVMQHHVDDEYDLDDADAFSLGAAVRGLVTGHWDDADLERRALSIATAGAGGHLLPAPIASTVIDRVRNQARVIEAGARTVEMEQNTLDLPRLTTGVAGAWRNENTAVAESDPVFDRVTLQARTLAVLTRLSYELFQDLTPAGAEIIEREIIQALAIELDRVALRGSGVAPEPEGVRNTTGVEIITNGANGTAYAWSMLVNAIAEVMAEGFDPNAAITHPRLLKSIGGLVDTTGQPLQPPGMAAELPILPTRQIPINLTAGSSSDTSELYVGQWDQLVIGFRPQLSLEIESTGGPGGMVGVKVGSERYMDTMQVGILAFLRADIGLLHPEAFAVSVGIRP